MKNPNSRINNVIYEFRRNKQAIFAAVSYTHLAFVQDGHLGTFARKKLEGKLDPYPPQWYAEKRRY